MKTLFIALASTLLLGAAPADTREIEAVIEAFRVAIIAKDRAAFERLPASDTITFMSSIDAATLARLRHKRPDVKRSRASSYAQFVTDVVTDPARQEEKFSNIVIHSDGSVATLWFDYSFVENGNMTNWGHESWGLIRSDAGWKISSIIYSVTLPAPKP